MFPVKPTVIYTFFAITSVQNTCFCSVFNALASKNPAKSCYVQCFFHFWPFFHCRKVTKMTQNSISIPSCAQTPKNPRKMSKTPPYSGLGAKPFLPPPAKADIATAILTNVIEHLVLLFCPPISTPSPPKRCGRILTHVSSWCFANASAFRSPMMSINWRLRALPPSGPFEPYIIPTARCFLCWTYAGDPANVLNSLKPKNSSLASPNTFRMCSFWQTRRPPNGITARI